MSIKINISYENESEIEPILELLKPVESRYKVKRTDKGTYKHLYLIERENNRK